MGAEKERRARTETAPPAFPTMRASPICDPPSARGGCACTLPLPRTLSVMTRFLSLAAALVVGTVALSGCDSSRSNTAIEDLDGRYYDLRARLRPGDGVAARRQRRRPPARLGDEPPDLRRRRLGSAAVAVRRERIAPDRPVGDRRRAAASRFAGRRRRRRARADGPVPAAPVLAHVRAQRPADARRHGLAHAASTFRRSTRRSTTACRRSAARSASAWTVSRTKAPATLELSTAGRSRRGRPAFFVRAS